MSNQDNQGRAKTPIIVALITAVGGVVAAIAVPLIETALEPDSETTIVEPFPQAEHTEATRAGDSNSSPTDDIEVTTPGSPTTDCTVTVGSLVDLMSEPYQFSRSLIRVPQGTYSVLNYSSDQRWFQIEAEGRTGWIENNTWTLTEKSQECP